MKPAREPGIRLERPPEKVEETGMKKVIVDIKNGVRVLSVDTPDGRLYVTTVDRAGTVAVSTVIVPVTSGFFSR